MEEKYEGGMSRNKGTFCLRSNLDLLLSSGKREAGELTLQGPVKATGRVQLPLRLKARWHDPRLVQSVT